MLQVTGRIMGTSYNTWTLPVLRKINKETKYNYKASLSPWGNKKPLLTNCSLDIHILYMIKSFFREANIFVFLTLDSSMLVSLHQEGDCKCWAQKCFWFTLGKTTQDSFSRGSTQPGGCGVLNAAPAASGQPHTDSYAFYCTPEEFNHDGCHGGGEDACQLLEGCWTRGAGTSALASCAAAQTV